MKPKAKPKAKAHAGLVLDPRNAKKHSDKNKKAIRQSLESVGPFRSIGAVRGVVKVGNGVYEQAQELGLKVKRVKADRDTLVVVDRDDMTEAEADRAALLDNLTADSSAFSYEESRFAELVKGDALLEAMAEEEYRYRVLLNQDAAFDPNAEWKGMPEHRSQEIRDTAICCLVRFRTVEDREAFEKFLGYKLSHKNNTYTTWFPKQDFDQLGRGTEFVSES